MKLLTYGEAARTPGTVLYRALQETERQRQLRSTLTNDQAERYWAHVVRAGRTYLSPAAWVAAGEPERVKDY
jgi:hypothetical protein